MGFETLYNKQKYLTYIAEHRNYVISAFVRIFVYNENKKFNVLVKEGLMDSKIYHRLAEDIMHHDESKYSDEEFDGYREKFYPDSQVRTEEENRIVDEKFEQAWAHHKFNNSHHLQYWFIHRYNPDTDTIEDVEEGRYDMPLFAIYHMICDWQGMCGTKGGTVIEWYTTKADDEKSYMTANTRALVDHILSILYDVPEEELR